LSYEKGYNTRTVKIIKDTDADRHRVISYMYKTPVPIFEDCDDMKSPKLLDFQQRLDDYFNALRDIQVEGVSKDVPKLSDYVLE
jgi:hypothetical protein